MAIVTDITTRNSQRKDTNLYIKSKQFKMEEGCSDGFQKKIYQEDLNLPKLMLSVWGLLANANIVGYLNRI